MTAVESDAEFASSGAPILFRNAPMSSKPVAASTVDPGGGGDRTLSSAPRRIPSTFEEDFTLDDLFEAEGVACVTGTTMVVDAALLSTFSVA